MEIAKKWVWRLEDFGRLDHLDVGMATGVMHFLLKRQYQHYLPLVSKNQITATSLRNQMVIMLYLKQC